MLKSRIIYSVIFFASLYFVYFYGGPVPWAIFFLVTLLPLLSFTYLLSSYFSFRYYESCPAKTFTKGEKLKYKCIFANNVFLPFIYVKIFIQTPDTVVSGKPDIKNESLITGKTKSLEYEIECRYRGRYDIGMLKVEFRDFLNLFQMSIKKENFLSIIIYPRIRISEEFINEGMAMSDFRVALFNKNKGDESLSNLREYSYGDSSRLIHWKLSARMQKLIVTDRESTFDSRVVLTLDLHSNDLTLNERIVYEDMLIEELVATAHYFLIKSIPVDFVYYKNGMVKWHGASMADFDELYNMLAEIEFTAETGIHNALYTILGDENTNNTYFIYCTRLSKELYESMTHIYHAEKNIFIRYCYMDKEDDEVYNYQRLLIKQGITIERLKEESDGEENTAIE